MIKILAVILAVATLPALPLSAVAATQFADSSASSLCGEAGAEGYKRPGGFCEQLDDLKSLVDDVDDDACATVGDAGFRYDEIQGRLLVAMPIDPCCNFAEIVPADHLPPEGILVATSGCPI